MQRKVILVLSVVLTASFGPMFAQDAPAPGAGGQRQGRGGGGEFAGMQRVAGEVTTVSGATLTLKTQDGGTVQVVTTDNTRVMKGNGGGASGQPSTTTVKVSDLKPGDGLTAMGNLDAPNKTLHAAMIVAVDAAQIKAARANWGKTYIAGKVTAIDMDNAKMTVQRPEGSSQVTIGLDETTSFKRGRVNLSELGELGGGFGGGGFGGGGRAGRPGGAGAPPPAESITLADIKVGDTVAGQGTVKGGVFVPGELTVATPGQGGRRRPNGAPGAPPAGDGATPPPGAGLN